MNYCVYLRKRKNKPYCKLIMKEITLYRCQECDNREYKNKRRECNKKNINTQKSKSMRVKSNKLAKLERKRFSVFTDNMDKCYFCENPRMDKHEIYRGKNRANSMKYGFVLPMCRYHHDKYQENVEFNDFWHRKGQKYYEDNIGSREEFLAKFRKNYLD